MVMVVAASATVELPVVAVRVAVVVSTVEKAEVATHRERVLVLAAMVDGRGRRPGI